MATYLTSGEMANANRLSRKALRVYREKGIIEPHHIDESNGRAYYGITQSTRMDLVGRLQGIGMSLDDIKAIIDSASIEELHNHTAKHVAALEAELAGLRHSLDSANEILDGCELYLDPPILDQIVLERFPARRILPFGLSEIAQLDDPLSCTAEEWEQVLRGIKQRIVEADLPLSLFKDVNSIIVRQEDGAYTTSHVFVYVDESYGDLALPTTYLPEGQYLTLYNVQGYNNAGRCWTRESIDRMTDYAQAKHFTVCGDIVEETLFRFPHLISSDGNLLWRMCVPVKRN